MATLEDSRCFKIGPLIGGVDSLLLFTNGVRLNLSVYVFFSNLMSLVSSLLSKVLQLNKSFVDDRGAFFHIVRKALPSTFKESKVIIFIVIRSVLIIFRRFVENLCSHFVDQVQLARAEIHQEGVCIGSLVFEELLDVELLLNCSFCSCKERWVSGFAWTTKHTAKVKLAFYDLPLLSLVTTLCCIVCGISNVK